MALAELLETEVTFNPNYMNSQELREVGDTTFEEEFFYMKDFDRKMHVGGAWKKCFGSMKCSYK